MSVTTSAGKPPAEILRAQLSSMSSQFKNALPSHIKPEKFQRVVMTVVQQNPDLLVADRTTLLASCTKCAADGLIPDGREAALVIFNTKVKRDGREEWVKAVQYMPMLAGIQKRARNSGEIAGIEAHVIYANDHFIWRQGTESTLEHTPLFPGDRGQAIGAYAVAKFKDGGTPQFEVMDRAAIEKVRQVSRSKDRGPWVDWWDEMARKTVFRRLSKWLPMDADADDLLRRDDEAEQTPAHDGPTMDATPEPAAQASKLDALEAAGEVVDGVIDQLDTPPSDADWLIEQIEAQPDSAALEKLLNNAATRTKVKGLSAEDHERVGISVTAARHGFAPQQGGR